MRLPKVWSIIMLVSVCTMVYTLRYRPRQEKAPTGEYTAQEIVERTDRLYRNLYAPQEVPSYRAILVTPYNRQGIEQPYWQVECFAEGHSSAQFEWHARSAELYSVSRQYPDEVMPTISPPYQSHNRLQEASWHWLCVLHLAQQDSYWTPAPAPSLTVQKYRIIWNSARQRVLVSLNAHTGTLEDCRVYYRPAHL